VINISQKVWAGENGQGYEPETNHPFFKEGLQARKGKGPCVLRYLGEGNGRVGDKVEKGKILKPQVPSSLRIGGKKGSEGSGGVIGRSSAGNVTSTRPGKGGKKGPTVGAQKMMLGQNILVKYSRARQK